LFDKHSGPIALPAHTKLGWASPTIAQSILAGHRAVSEATIPLIPSRSGVRGVGVERRAAFRGEPGELGQHRDHQEKCCHKIIN
jgi:hypothetical protein